MFGKREKQLGGHQKFRFGHPKKRKSKGWKTLDKKKKKKIEAEKG